LELRLRLWDHGGAGPRVLFVHGFLDTGRSFDAVARELMGTARCLCLDLRGHGESDRAGPGGSYHLLDHVKDVSLVLRKLAERGESPALLVGHSMGGNVALMLAGTLADDVPPVLLLDALGPPAEDPEDQPDRLARLLASLERDKPFSTFASLDDALDRLQTYNPGLTREGARRMAAPVLRETEDGRLAFPFDARLRGPTPVRYPEAMWSALCARVTRPVRVLRAENGYVPDGEPATTRLAAMPDAQLTTLPGVGHHLHVDAPAAVADAVRALLP
jgi:pimeloyl-ACP methyl ester carboxylesterase